MPPLNPHETRRAIQPVRIWVFFKLALNQFLVQRRIHGARVGLPDKRMVALLAVVLAVGVEHNAGLGVGGRDAEKLTSSDCCHRGPKRGEYFLIGIDALAIPERHFVGYTQCNRQPTNRSEVARLNHQRDAIIKLHTVGCLIYHHRGKRGMAAMMPLI